MTFCSNPAPLTDSALQTVATDASQKLPEYKEKQDITAPPDPIAKGSTSDVPIHGEKTNILFHPTPSISYEPMFAALEKRATILGIAIFFAIAVFGKMFGGVLIGLIPLAGCISSGVWLWMKEVVRSGREVEWSSEQTRGETVRIRIWYDENPLTSISGCRKLASRVRRMDEQLSRGRVGTTQPRHVCYSCRHTRGRHASISTWLHRECKSC